MEKETSEKKDLLEWARKMTDDMITTKPIENFEDDWKDGLILWAIIQKILKECEMPDLIHAEGAVFGCSDVFC
jgi:hypothetical protein